MVKYYSAVNQYGRVSEYAEFNGLKYYILRNGYYKRTNKPYTLLHRDVWLFHGFTIPEGYEVHHKDHDKKNNTIDNLVLLTKSNHAKLHQEENEPKELICNICGNTFQSNAIHDRAKFCNGCLVIHEKQRKSQWTKDNKDRLNQKSLDNYHSKIYNENRICLHCNHPFSVIKTSPQTYCSRSCASSATNKTKEGPKYNNSKSTFICPICGNEYITYISGRNHKQTCSLECSYKHRFKKI